MSNLYNVIAQLCKTKGISGYRLCKEIGIQPSILTDLKVGRKQSLSAETLSKIAAHFNVSVDYLLGNEIEKAPTETGERDSLDEVDIGFYNGYKDLDEADKEILRDMVRVMRERRANNNNK